MAVDTELPGNPVSVVKPNPGLVVGSSVSGVNIVLMRSGNDGVVSLNTFTAQASELSPRWKIHRKLLLALVPSRKTITALLYVNSTVLVPG